MLTPQRLFILLLFISISATAQQRFSLKHADTAHGASVDGVPTTFLEGKVTFALGNVIVHCDSAQVVRRNNHLEASGQITLTENSTTLLAKQLIYNNDDIIHLKNGVILTKAASDTLYFDLMAYRLKPGGAKSTN